MTSVSNQQSLQRILARPGVNKYATVSKFLTGASNTGQVASVSETSEADVAQTDLDLLDSLVEQTLLSRPSDDQSSAVSARAKETLSKFNSDQLANSEIANTAEVSSEVLPSSQEIVASSEIQELSKELQEVSKETREQREQALIQEKQRAINDLAAASSTPVAVDNQPVVVLPITAASKEEAKFKTTAYSVKWLWQWCQKIAKMFAGAVVYKEEVEEA